MIRDAYEAYLWLCTLGVVVVLIRSGGWLAVAMAAPAFLIGLPLVMAMHRDNVRDRGGKR